MPELPEVETLCRGLNKLVVGRKISHVTFDNAKSFPNSNNDIDNFVIGHEIESISRRAKVLIIGLSSGYSMLVHLKMTGQLVYVGKERFGAGHPSNSLVDKLPDKSTRVIFNFIDGSNLYFNDQRKFGWIKLIPTIDIINFPFIAKLGPEPLDNKFTYREFHERLKKRQNSVIKAALLDQTVIAGVGNIYADESLWGAKIHPQTRVKDLSIEQIKLLFDDLVYVLQLSIDKGGSSNRNYVNAEGQRGSFTDFARVFRRENQPCPRCGEIIIKIRTAGRGTHLCPVCQKLN